MQVFSGRISVGLLFTFVFLSPNFSRADPFLVFDVAEAFAKFETCARVVVLAGVAISGSTLLLDLGDPIQMAISPYLMFGGAGVSFTGVGLEVYLKSKAEAEREARRLRDQENIRGEDVPES